MAAAGCRALARCFAIALLGLAGTAGAQTSGFDLVGIATTSTDQLYFACGGSPTCSGEFVVVSQDSGCSNLQTTAGTVQLTVPDISVAGPVSGSGSLVADWSSHQNPDGTCTPIAGGNKTVALSFTGTSDGIIASVTFTATDPDGTVHQLPGSLIRASASFGSAQASGSFGGSTGGGGSIQGTFSCTGSPFCTGTYSATLHDGGCSNSFAIAGTITFTGFDLSAGSFGGSVVLQNANTHDTQNADGTCTVGSTTDHSGTYAATFDGSAGTFTLNGTDDKGNPISVPGNFSATGIGSTPPPTSPPPFQISVNPNIGPVVSSATAQIVPPAADLGKTVSLYVFAFAPRSLVKSASRLAMKDDVSGCELAQYDPATGQLRAASATNLAAAFTGTLTAQGQSVTILSNASTPAIAGATFFVGYGADASTMISNGVNANAVQIPGSQQCPTVFPKTPAGLSGLWYAGEAESGWGIDFTQRGSHMFVAFYTYDANGNPKWYVSDNCALPGSAATSGICTGNLYEVTGASPLFGIGPGGTGGSASKVGTLQVNFADPSHATLSFTIGSVSRTVPIVRQLVRSASTIDYTDLWYAGAQAPGWGMAISQQSSAMFLAWFVYDPSGKPVWYVAPACTVVTSGNGCSGDLLQVTGPPFGPSFDPSKIHATKVGTVAATFTDPNNGTINYTVNGTTGSKAITRQVF